MPIRDTISRGLAFLGRLRLWNGDLGTTLCGIDHDFAYFAEKSHSNLPLLSDV
jgi:hypothetical protein